MGNKRDEYGFLGVFYKCDNKISEFLEKTIDKEDLDEEFGIEKESHVTVLFGFLPEVNKEEIIPAMEDKVIFPKDIAFNNISLFENDDYDVLKLDVESEKLKEYNKFFSDNFPFKSDFPDYHPHLTLAYIKKGEGSKYVTDEILEEITKVLQDCNSLYYEFSDADKNKTTFKILC